jgi:hypothetical protein
MIGQQTTTRMCVASVRQDTKSPDVGNNTEPDVYAEPKA